MTEDQINENWKAENLFEDSNPFDFSAIEQPDIKLEFAKKLVEYPGDLEDAILEVAKPYFQRYGGTVVSRFLGLVCNSRNPRMICKVLTYVAGLSDQSLAEIADEEGVTKQAINQTAEELREDLNLPLARAQRSEAARGNMSASYAERKLNT
jgi:hypothetical protein